MSLKTVSRSEKQVRRREMEFTRRYLPMEWEERWRKEKEMRKRLIEEGGKGIERDRNELRKIVAYNDTRMGLASGSTEVRISSTNQELSGKNTSDEAFGDDGYKVHLCCKKSFPLEVFATMKEFQDLSLLTDLILTTQDGSSFHIHSLILATVSTFIMEKLRDKSEGQSVSIQEDGDHMWSIRMGPEVSYAGLKAVIEFAYGREFSSLNKEALAEIKVAAQLLKVQQLVDLFNNVEKTENGECLEQERQTISAVEQMSITLQSIEQLWVNKVGCDVILDVDGVFLHVHRVILAANSDYFRGMFTCGMRESYETCIALPFLSATELKALIDCAYSGTLKLTWDSVFEITCTALQLQFQTALMLCLKFLREEMQTCSCLDVASFAEAYGMTELLEEANDFVLRNFMEVSATAKFQDLSPEKLLDFLCCDGLCVPSELAVFRAVISWIEADPEDRLAHASLLMSGVRFPLMTFREFREVRAINLRMECFAGMEVELYGSALKEFGFSLPKSQDHNRVRRPKDVLTLIGGDQLNPDMGQRVPSREVWYANSLCSGTGLVKDIEWRRLSEIPDKAKFRHGVAVMDGKLFVVGGCYFYTKDDIMKSAYSYDPVRDSWKRLADMQEARSNFSVVVLEERLYAIGGDKEINTNIDSNEMYDQDTDSWSYVQPLDQALSGYAAVALNEGVFISGGFNCKYVCLVSMILYHPKRGSIYLADMTHDRAQHCMEALKGRLYVAGGVCNLKKFYTNQPACEVYDPVVDSWTEFLALSVPHVGAASSILEGKVYVMGGYCQDDYSESGLVHRFDPTIQRWETMGKLPGAVTDIKACLLHLPKHLRQ